MTENQKQALAVIDWAIAKNYLDKDKYFYAQDINNIIREHKDEILADLDITFYKVIETSVFTGIAKRGHLERVVETIGKLVNKKYKRL